MRRRIIRGLTGVLAGELAVCRRSLKKLHGRVLAGPSLALFDDVFLLYRGFSVRLGLTFELAPGFIVWDGISGGTGSSKRKYRTHRTKIRKGIFDRNQHQGVNPVQMRKTFNLGSAQKGP